MRLRSVEIETPGFKFKSELFAGNGANPFDSGSLAFTVVAGPNGSGKTQLLSSIARTFHHAGWHPDKAPAFARLGYEMTTPAGITEFSITSQNQDVRVAKWGELKRSFLDDEIPTVICSVFSTRGEYPARKQSNFLGHRKTKIFDIAHVYGKNHFSIGSLSRGIARLMSKEWSEARKTLQDITGLRIGSKILVQGVSIKEPPPLGVDGEIRDYYFRRLPDPVWEKMSSGLSSRVENGEVYLNDFEIFKESRKLTLLTLSAGQKMLFIRLLSLLSEMEDNALVLIEEPELHLDPNWCSSFSEILIAFFSRFNAHFILSTQSPSVVRCFSRSQTLFLGIEQADLPEIFLASESIVTDVLYRFGVFARIDKAAIELFHSDVALQPADLLGEGPVRFLLRSKSVSKQTT
jgi:energy-coupling factor transporter ATP-binding protein EcfA2